MEPNVAEIKRIFVLPESRGTEIASKVLTEIETKAIEEKHVVFILKNQKKTRKSHRITHSFWVQNNSKFGAL